MNTTSKLLLRMLMLCAFMSNIYAQDIYVAKDGNDNNSGTLAAPFLTIGKAASVAVAGNIVHIREGVYEETLKPTNSGVAGSPIIFQGYQNEKVVISAMQKVNGFTQDTGNIYKVTLDWNLDQRMFVIHDNTLMDLARWPNNTDGDRFTINALRNDGGSGPDVNGYLLDSEIPNLPWQNGGSLFFYGDRPGSGWLTWRLPITASSPGRVDYQSTFNSGANFILNFHPPRDGGEFFLEGIKEALDYQNEWYQDASTNELFVQLPGGVAPADGSIQVSRRENTVDIRNRNYIEVRNLAVFGGTVIMNGNNNKLYQVSSFYGGMTRGSNATGFTTGTAAVIIGFSNPRYQNNIIEKCEVAYADGSGIRDTGNGTIIKNNYVHDCGYLGNYDAPVLVRDGSNNNILNNTITKGGRDAIQLITNNSEVAWNDVSRSNLVADDCGLFYYSGSGNAAAAAAAPKNITIHHNWFHDAESRGSLKKAAGIYLDTNPNSFDVYNNVVWNVEWTGIQMNWNALNINVYNNTFVKVASGAMGAWHLTGTAFSDVNVWNNITDVQLVDDPNTQESESTWEVQSDQQNNLIDTNTFVDYTNNNFELIAGGQAVDFGRIITGFTDGFQGAAPDAGAYEFGVPAWKPGVDWNMENGPNNICYDLPGEFCNNVLSVDEFDAEVFKIRRNPVSTVLSFATDQLQGEPFEIYSILGQKELQGVYGGVIDVTSLRTGIHFIRIKNVAVKFIKR